MKHVLLKLASASLPLIAAGCAGGAAGMPAPVDDEFSREPGLRVEVQNQNFYPATIYTYRAGTRRRLGQVEAHQTTSFSFEWPLGDLRFLIDFLATGCIITESLGVDDGDDLLLILQAQDNRKALRQVCRR